MRFKEYILEDDVLPTRPTSKSITLANAVKWVKTMAPNVMNNISQEKLHLFRGVEDTVGDFQLGNSKSFRRSSKNTMNYYTRFIATSKLWEKYPSREHAYICSNKSSIAEGYGDVFYVIPADDAKVGIANTYDMWKAFPALENSLSIPGLNSLNHMLQEMMLVIDGKITPDTDIEAVRAKMRGWTLKILHDFGDYKLPVKRARPPSWVFNSVQDAVIVMSQKGFSNFEELLEYCLDPSVNNIETIRAMDARVPAKPAKEIWFEGSAIFIRATKYQEFIEEYNKK